MVARQSAWDTPILPWAPASWALLSLPGSHEELVLGLVAWEGGVRKRSIACGFLACVRDRVLSWVRRTVSRADLPMGVPGIAMEPAMDTHGWQSLAGDTISENWGTDSCLNFTTNEAALKSDAWLVEPNGEKSRLLPTTLAAHHLPGRWVSGRGGGTISATDSADLCVSPLVARLPSLAGLQPSADMRSLTT